MNPPRIHAMLLAVLALPALQEPAREAAPRPDAELQDGLRRLLSATTPEAQRAELDFLRAKGGTEHELLVPQLFLFSETAHDTREAMLAGVVLDQLHVPAEHVVAALVPLLENLESKDRTRRAALARALSQYEDISIERGADFAIYRPYLEHEPPLGLVRHLFETDPDAALLALTHAQVREIPELRALLWAGHELADLRWKLRFEFVAREELPRAAPEAAESLATLARHGRWWARLAAAQLLLEEPGMRQAVSLDALARDVHPLVRELAAAAADEKR